jgi:RNA polymerase sigma-70 factor (ECF subfamily)
VRDDPSRPLIERIQAGEDPDRSFEQLYHLHRTRVLSFFSRLGFTPPESEELAQETFLRVHRSLGKFEHGSRFERWLFVVAANVYRNEIRRRRSEKRGLIEVSLDDPDEESRGHEVPVLASPAPSPLDDALRQEGQDVLRDAVAALPKQMRRCVLFRIYHQLKYRDIAELMGISIESVKAHLHQAQDKLRNLVAERARGAGDEDDDAGPPSACGPRRRKSPP